MNDGIKKKMPHLLFYTLNKQVIFWVNKNYYSRKRESEKIKRKPLK